MMQLDVDNHNPCGRIPRATHPELDISDTTWIHTRKSEAERPEKKEKKEFWDESNYYNDRPQKRPCDQRYPEKKGFTVSLSQTKV